MKKVIIIHGWSEYKSWMNPDRSSPSNAAFIPWLSKQLIVNNIHTIAPEMPNSYLPNYNIWKKELERFELDKDTTLVGWSCGGGFLVRYLSENDVRIDRLILLAPWIGTFREEFTDFDLSFFDFEIDSQISGKTKRGVYLFEAGEESDDVNDSVEIVKKSIEKINIKKITNSGYHFNKDKQPELLGEILQ